MDRSGEAIGNWLARNRVVAWGLTMLFVNVGWLFFFYPVPNALNMLNLLFAGIIPGLKHRLG